MSAATIDIHAHWFPETYIELIRRKGERFGAEVGTNEAGKIVVKVGRLIAAPLGDNFIDLDTRLDAMARNGVGVQALSLTQPMVYWADPSFSRELTECFNDALLAANDLAPDKLYGLAILPMQVPELAVAEIDRLADEKAIRGVYLATNILGVELSDARFFPVYERLQALGWPIFLHPLDVIGMDRLMAAHFLHNLLGNPFDTAVAAAHLVFGGVLDRFPGLDWCLPHAGGAFPGLIGRLEHGWKVRPELNKLEKGPRDYLPRFYYDTISHDPAALHRLIDAAGAERIMLGSDYCFDMGYDRPVEVVDNHPDLGAEAKAAIKGGNAARLLKMD